MTVSLVSILVLFRSMNYVQLVLLFFLPVWFLSQMHPRDFLVLMKVFRSPRISNLPTHLIAMFFNCALVASNVSRTSAT